MPRLSIVEFWPPTGSVDQPWIEDISEDAFVKTARRVCERFSEALRDAPDGARIDNRVATIRFTTARHDDPHRRAPNPPVDPSSVLVEASVDPTEGFELARVTLPEGIETLTAQGRAHLVLEVVHGATDRLALARGWDRRLVAAARQHVIDHDYGYEEIGPWKANRSRRDRARCVFTLADDGFGRLTVQVSEADSDEVVASSGPYLAHSTHEGFTRSMRTLRWTSTSTVQVDPFIDILGRGDGAVILDLTGKATTPAYVATPSSVEHRTVAGEEHRHVPVVVRGFGASAPEQPHEMHVGGGGPMNGISKDYVRALDKLLAQLEREPWQLWWSHSPVALLDIYYWFNGSRPAIRVQRRSNSGTASITRPTRDQGRGVDGVEQANADVTALVARLRARFDLPPPPELRLVDPTPKTTRPSRPSP